MELRIRNTILNQRNIYLQTSINQKNLDIRELQKSNKELTSTNIDLQRGKEQFENACQELNGDLRTRIDNLENEMQSKINILMDRVFNT